MMAVHPRDADPAERVHLAMGRRVTGCPPPDLLLPAMAGEVLSPRLTAAVLRHLDDCPLCAELVPALHAGSVTLGGADRARLASKISLTCTHGRLES